MDNILNIDNIYVVIVLIWMSVSMLVLVYDEYRVFKWMMESKYITIGHIVVGVLMLPISIVMGILLIVKAIFRRILHVNYLKNKNTKGENNYG